MIAQIETERFKFALTHGKEGRFGFSLRGSGLGTAALRLACALAAAVLMAEPAWALGWSAYAPVQAGVMLVGQKSALDDLGEEEEEEPLPETAAPAETPPEMEEPPAEMEEPPAEMEEPPGTEEAPGSAGEAPPAATPSSPLDRSGEEEEEEGAMPSGPGQGPPGTDAGEAADDEDELEVEPVCDVVLLRKTQLARLQSWKVVLFKEYLGSKPGLSERKRIESLLRFSERGTTKVQVKGWQIEGFDYYEERMGRKAADLVGLTYERLATPGTPVDLSDEVIAEDVEQSEEILSTAIAEHDSAVQRRMRRGAKWKEKIRQPLVQARLNLRLSEVDQLIRQERFQQAEAQCDRLVGELDRDGPLVGQVLSRVEAVFETRAEAALAVKDYATVHELLDQWMEYYTGEPGGALGKVRKQLVDKATELARRAESLKDTSPREARQLLAAAATIWPPLAQLDELRRQMAEEYPILHCAYSELPQHLAPMTARSAVERHAMSLIFESLVRWVDDPQSGAHYTCELAATWPDPLIRGRDFKLRRATWSDSNDHDSHFCLVEDVRRTLQILRDPTCPGYSPAWSQLLAGVDNAPDEDPYRALVRLDRDYWQPLSLMDFKVLPGRSFRKTAVTSLKEQVQEFSQNPVGTGPYQLGPSGADPDAIRFVANPYYRGPQRPSIREIVFHRRDPIQAADEFVKGELHLIYGVQKEHVNQLLQSGKKVVALRTPTVTFLAPNYRKRWLKNENIRLAIAHAIDRPAILEQYFRAGGREGDHAELTGPFPRRCWANDPSVADFQPELAEAYAGKAFEELGVEDLTLRLVYPGGSRDVESACKRIAEDVKSRTGIALSLERVEPGKFYDQVTRYHDFDLAYWNHTFEDSTYWLEPLLDAAAAAREPGGPNFMGYVPDEDLGTLFRELRRHKQFRRIEALAHQIHKHVARQAIIVPLWQLDTYVAVSDQLENVTLDPFTLFGNIERWNIKTDVPF